MAPDDFPAGGYVADYLVMCAVWLALVAAAVVHVRRSRSRPGRLRLVAGNALVLLALLATLGLGAETYLRYVYDTTDQWAITLTNFSWMRRHVRINSLGAREREFARVKPAGTVRVACLGDSFTMGWGVADPRDTYPARVDAALAAKAPGTHEVLNLGFIGLGTKEEADFLEKFAPRAGLDRVILGYCLNDSDDPLPEERRFKAERLPRVPLLPPTFSFTADLLWHRFVLMRDPRVAGYYEWIVDAYANPVVWEPQKAQFARLASICRANGIRLDVVVFPFFSDWGDAYRFGSCHERVAAAFRDLGVNVLDLSDVYRGVPREELVVNRFDGHPNERAHELAAKAIVDRLF